MMPALAIVDWTRRRWIPPLPIPLVLFWPVVWLCAGLARLLERDRPNDAATLHAAVQVCHELGGLDLDIDARDHRSIRIRFL